MDHQILHQTNHATGSRNYSNPGFDHHIRWWILSSIQLCRGERTLYWNFTESIEIWCSRFHETDKKLVNDDDIFTGGIQHTVKFLRLFPLKFRSPENFTVFTEFYSFYGILRNFTEFLQILRNFVWTFF